MQSLSLRENFRREKAGRKCRRDVNSPARIALSAIRIAFMLSRRLGGPPVDVARTTSWYNTNCAQLSYRATIKRRETTITTALSDRSTLTGWRLDGESLQLQPSGTALRFGTQFVTSAILGDIRRSAQFTRSSTTNMTNPSTTRTYKCAHTLPSPIAATNHAFRFPLTSRKTVFVHFSGWFQDEHFDLYLERAFSFYPCLCFPCNER